MAVAFDKVRTRCSWCDSEFRLRSGGQLGALNSGRAVYCSVQCRNAKGNLDSKHRFQCGPCPTCGKVFPSHYKHKQFCSIGCYTVSPQLQERLKAHNDSIRTPEHACPNCGKQFHKRANKYCSDFCRRTYFAERFDRWVANPESLALPQCYDEFLLQTELPCLVPGCDWSGKCLSLHCNTVHGITAEQLKELGGFNVTTGLVSVDMRQVLCNRFDSDRRAMLSDRLKDMASEGKMNGCCSAPRQSPRLEGREHRQKSLALMMATGESRDAKPCRMCGAEVSQPTMGRRLYCSTKCRSAYYQKTNAGELQCSHCGAAFMAKRNQVNRAKRGQKVCCSDDCRNKMNMIACLASRGVHIGK